MLLTFYEKHKIGALESFENERYRRLFIDKRQQICQVVVFNQPQYQRLAIEISATCRASVADVIKRLTHMFDLQHNPNNLHAKLSWFQNNSDIGSLNSTRKIGCWDPFELAISAILGQLISIKQATKLTETLMLHYGDTTIDPYNHTKCSLFPKVQVLATSELEHLKIPHMKKVAIKTLAKEVLKHNITFARDQDLTAFRQKLMMIKGIGRWTAEYIALRALGDKDAYPENDAFLQKLLSQEHAENSRPWRAYLVSYCYIYSDKINSKNAIEFKHKQADINMSKEKAMSNTLISEVIYQTPFGYVKLQANNEFLLSCHWLKHPDVEIKSDNAVLQETISQLDAYFAKKLKIFDLPLQLRGTPFQKNIWQILQKIPFGETLSYQALARSIDNSKAARAVGSANAKNPIVIIIPCHRVIKSDGQIGGYAGGIACKEKLIALERTTKQYFS